MKYPAVIQRIEPLRNIFFAGENITLKLSGVPDGVRGRAVVRTNIGRASMRRRELVERTEKRKSIRNSDWHDIEMTPDGAGCFSLKLPLPEVGSFEAKCCFLPERDAPALWPSSGNFQIKVEPAENVAGNTVYCAFVRQWNSWMDLPHSPALPDSKECEDAGYTVIPPSGTFRSLISHLDHIFDTLNCRILQLLPIHPVPVSYGRMGRYGSPFAATDYFAVDPALAEFDECSTPMEQFEELINAVHCRRGRIFMDIPVNHTGWASKLQCEHPDYFVRNDDKRFENPGAWGIVWADLCRLDYHNSAVHELMAKVFLFWCRRGVDGFRCDAGYMVPEKAWDYIVSRVREEYPDTVFLLEGLGGPLPVQEHLLSQSGLNWGYSELFQNYSRDEISRYYPYMDEVGNRTGTLINFAETHDNDRLAAKGKSFARLRFMVTALLAQHGAFGFANGAEFYASEKIDVHGCGALNFGNPDNLNTLIGKMNRLLADHPAFGINAGVRLIQHGEGNAIAAWRSGKDLPPLLILLNLDCSKYTDLHFENIGFFAGIDLLTGQKVTFETSGNSLSLTLAPGEGRCISFDDYEIPAATPSGVLPDNICRQMAAAMAQNLILRLKPFAEVSGVDGEMMRRDPLGFVSQCSGQSPAPVTVFDYPADCHRLVALPLDDLLLIRSSHPFALDIRDGKKTVFHGKSLPFAGKDGEFILTGLPQNDTGFEHPLEMVITGFAPGKTERSTARLLQLPDGEKRRIRLSCRRGMNERRVFGTNNLGSYAMFGAAPGRPESKYDAILAANINKEFPVDRRVMFSNFRAWLVIDEYSHELSRATIEEFTAHPDNRASMLFALPDGRGGVSRVVLDFFMCRDADQVFLRFRHLDNDGAEKLPGKLIIRPDVEDRVNHAVTRACDGAEHLFRKSVTAFDNGFDFQPAERKLMLRVDRGEFYHAPEWRYMVDLAAERYYGLPDKTDLFSPGYFSIPLDSGEEVILGASAGTADLPEIIFPAETECEEMFAPLHSSAAASALAVPVLARFVVKRDNLASVIAGYPWFLDWGRDTLIVLRGLVRFPEFQKQSFQILCRFAAFERQGTIPNMICGDNDSNRDTSDAPLYLIVALRDYIRSSGDAGIMDVRCGGRTMKEVVDSIVYHYKHGTPNGIIMDAESGLIFSPAHFSWMDTNYPAGTPRQGYPIEIQSLWYAVLKWLNDADAEKVRHSIQKYFFSSGKTADCLHCDPGTPAAEATPDDHLRCNILTAITFGAVADKAVCSRILETAGRLLVPGAIRTLDDAPVTFLLPVNYHGKLLNDPALPYQGYYRGPEDTSRKAAYHNGTAWCWPFASYCEALYLVGGENSRRRALSLLMSEAMHFESGVTGQLPEIADGDYPHRPGGCPAQAWSASEFFRVLKLLEKK